MSDEQLRIQRSIFAPNTYANSTREDAIRELHRAGVVNLDGTLTEEYKFMDPNYQR